jgi:hypothetical protein
MELFAGGRIDVYLPQEFSGFGSRDPAPNENPH